MRIRKAILDQLSIAAGQNTKERDYWLKQLSGDLEKSSFPYDFKESAPQEPCDGKHILNFVITGDLFLKLIKLSNASDHMLHMVLVAGWVLLLDKYTFNGNGDIIVGSPIYRQEDETEGRLINTVLPLRHRLTPGMTFKELLLQVRETIVQATEHYSYPMELLPEQMGLASSGSNFSLFDVAILVENIHHKSDLEHLPIGMTISFLRIGEKIQGKLEYNTGLFRERTTAWIIKHFLYLMAAVLSDVNQEIQQLSILSPEEKNQILYEFNTTEREYPVSPEDTIHRWFQQQVQYTPARMALAFKDRQLTYKELNQKANQLAHFLRAGGVKPNNIVGLMVEPSLEMVIGILGILKSGGAYLPIDTDYPGKRMLSILNEGCPRLLLTARRVIEHIGPAFWEKLQINGVRVTTDKIIPLDAVSGELSRYPEENPGYINCSGDLLYLIGTSGSTGRPKGVMLEHRNMINLLYFDFSETDIDFSDHVMQFASIGFDVSPHEIFSTFLRGGKLWIVDRIMRTDFHSLFDFMEKRCISVVFLPPALLKFVFKEPEYRKRFPLSTRHILAAGEQLIVPPRLKTYLKENQVYLYNYYGPAETHVVTALIIDPNGDIPGRPSIGKPVSNTKIYILDNHMRIQPIGVTGEMYISGANVGRGYYNREDLTTERFIGDPFNPAGRMYRSGDLARWLPDGNIEFIGRRDHQVKIRGFRVELGEIEIHLMDINYITEAVVIEKNDETGDNYLCAYIVSEKNIDISELRRILSDSLPDFMIPAYFVQISGIPLTAHGKVDKRALPEPGTAGSQVAYTPPENEIEETLQHIWSGLLDIEKHYISVTNDFFQLGGNSLKATILTAKIHKAFNLKITLGEMFKKTTIRDLSKYIESRRGEDRHTLIKPVEKKEYYVLSSAQRRLYILQQMDETAVVYNLPLVVYLEGTVDENRLEYTFQQLIKRHESSRTSIQMVQGEPVQRIHPDARVEVKVDDNEGTRGLAPLPKELAASTIQDFIRPFDLSQAPLLRVGLIKLEAGKSILMVDMHHIITDGISLRIFSKEFVALYSGQQLPPLRLQYKDYSQWQTGEQERRAVGKQEESWLKQFEGEIPVLALPLDFARPALQQFEGKTVTFEIDKTGTGALRRIAAAEGATLFMVLITLYTIFLSKISNQEDIVIGTPVSGRRHTDLEPIIGMLVNTLALRNYPTGEKDFHVFLLEVKERTLQAFDNQLYPFEDLVEKLGPQVNKDTSRNPLFDVMFVLDDGDITDIKIPGLQLLLYPFENRTAKFDLTLQAIQLEQGLRFNLEYSTALFKEETIQRLIGCFKRVVSVVVEDVEKKISGIEIISPQEKKQLLVDFNNTEAQYPKNKTVHELFTAQVERTPNNIALTGVHETHEKKYNMSSRSHMSYKELNEKSNQLACLLLEKGVRPDTIAAIMMERSVEMIIGILGILKAGGAYLPIDPDYPEERIDYMLKDSNARLIIKKSEIRNPKSETNPNDPNSNDQNKKAGVTVLDFEHLNFEFSIGCPRRGLSNFEIRASNLSPSNLAYIIYTSGTTGPPKGVMIEHRNVVRLLFNNKFQFDFNDRDIWTMFHSYCFDFSVWEMYGALLYGGKLVVLNRMEAVDPATFAVILEKEKVTVLNMIPSIFYNFENKVPGDDRKRLKLRFIIFGGEKLNPLKLKKWHRMYPKTKLINMYGITETTVHVTFKEITAREIDKNISSIGRAIPTLTVYIIDRNLNLVPTGIAGELCVGGLGLARGYLNRPQLTGEKFDHDLWDLQDYQDEKINQKFLRGAVRKEQSAGRKTNNTIDAVRKAPCAMRLPPGRRRQKLYKTGDYARWLVSGDMEYLGRMDHQVKIRGFRLELGEIENQLLRHKEIKAAVVTVGETSSPSGTTGKYLGAYIAAQRDIAVSHLREYLSKKLPHYMIPSYFMRLEEIPVTHTGKLNRSALPTFDMKGENRYSPPRDALEEKLAAIWSEVLSVRQSLPSSPVIHPTIGIDDNFFERGGHSLDAALIVSKIHKELQVKIPLSEVFLTPTIRGISQYIRKIVKDQYKTIDPVEKKEYYALSPAQKRVYLLQRMNPGNTAYNIFFTVPLPGYADIEKLKEIFMKLIARHENFRTSIEVIEDEPVQRIHDKVNFKIEYFNVNIDPVEDKDQGTDDRRQKTEDRRQKTEDGRRKTEDRPGIHPSSVICHLSSEFIRPFDLSRAPLLRVGLVITAAQGAFLLLDMHHVISDGESLQVLRKDFQALRESKGLPVLRLRYKDYALWLNRPEQQRLIKGQQDYWTRLFPDANLLPALDLPTDYPRPLAQRFEGGSVRFELNRRETADLKKAARENEVTLFMFILSMFNVLLSKLSGQEDIIVGVPVSGRSHANLENIMGMFVNTIALRNYPIGEKTFEEFLEEVKKSTLAAYENREYPFEELVEKLSLPRDTGRNPIFDVMFNMVNYGEYPDDHRQGQHHEDDDYDPHTSVNMSSKFDMTLRVVDQGNKIRLSLEYAVGLFKRKTIRYIVDYFRNIVNSVVYGPTGKLADIRVLPRDKIKEILSYFNEDLHVPIGVGSIREILPASFQKHRDRVAIESGSMKFTYSKLDAASTHAAGLICRHGLQKGSFIGVFMNKGAGLILAITGIVKAGGVFVPLDTVLPLKRLESMVKHTDTRVIFTDVTNEEKARTLNPGKETRVIIVDETFFIKPGMNMSLKNRHCTSADQSYVYFTSGTTGTPKAILGSNRGLLHFINWEIRAFDIDETFKFSQLTRTGFDVFLRDIFVPLCAGGTVCIPGDEQIISDNDKIVHWLENKQINLVHCVPSIFKIINSNNLSGHHLKSLRYILLAGEEIPPAEIEKWFAVFNMRIQLVNIYGPTETTLAKAYHLIRQDDARKNRIPVGKPIKGTRMILLDKNMNACSRGIVGELYIRTPYRSHGYCNQPEATANRFIPNPFHHDTTEVIYKTGDLGRQLESGDIELLGRVDGQVKIRGIRIELGEIEMRLRKYEGVREAVVLGKEKNSGEKFLCAYIVSDRRLSAAELREYLSGYFPGYMVPSYFIPVDAIPLAPNGKIDREALPAPGLTETPGEYYPPANELEKKLVEIWSGLLNINKKNLSVDANFFELGGHSLKAMIMAAKIYKELNVKLPLAEIFRSTSIREIAALISTARQTRFLEIVKTEKKEFYRLSFNQMRLWILHQLNPDSVSYIIHGEVALPGKVDKAAVKKALSRMLERHDSLRTGFKEVDGDPVQFIRENVDIPLSFLDIPGAGQEEKKAAAARLFLKESTTPFDLSHPPLFRAVLASLDETHHEFMFNMHHIVSDGWSMGILKQEFSRFYEGYTKGKEIESEPVKLQYKDFTEWQYKQLTKAGMREKALGYWQERFKEGFPPLNLPGDASPTGDNTDSTGVGFRFFLGKEVTPALERLAVEHHSTLFMVMFAAYNIFLSVISSQQEIVCAVISAGRDHISMHGIVGVFVNSIPVKHTLDPEEDFSDLLIKVNRSLLETFQYQDYPLELLVEELGVGCPGTAAAFNMFNMQDDSREIECHDMKFNQVKDLRNIKFDIILLVTEYKNGIQVELNGKSSRFTHQTMEFFTQGYQKLLRDIAQEWKQNRENI